MNAENKVLPYEICKILNRYTIESIYDRMFYVGLHLLTLDDEIFALKYIDLQPWNCNFIFNLTLAKNFRQPETKILPKTLNTLLKYCWENFNVTDIDILKSVNGIMINERIFQEQLYLYCLRNTFFLYENELNKSIQIIRNPTFHKKVKFLIALPCLIKSVALVLIKNGVKSDDEYKQVFIKLLNRLQILNFLKIDYDVIRLEYEDKKNKLDLMLTLSPLFNWPIIEYNSKTFIPCPYMLIMSTGYSLINKISYSISSDKILANTMEEYVYKIIEGDPKIEATWREFEYGPKKERKFTTDVIYKYKQNIVFCECKLKRVSNEFRQFKESKMDSLINEIAIDFLQIYKRMLDYKKGKFSLGDVYVKNPTLIGKIVTFDAIPPFIINDAKKQFFENLKNMSEIFDEEILVKLDVISLYDLEWNAYAERGVLDIFDIKLEANKSITNSFMNSLDGEFTILLEEALEIMENI